MNNQQQTQQEKGKNPMNVDANVIFDAYQKQVTDLEWDSKIKKAQINNYQKLVNELQEEIRSLQAQVDSLTPKSKDNNKSSKDKKQ